MGSKEMTMFARELMTRPSASQRQDEDQILVLNRRRDLHQEVEVAP